MQNPKQEPSSSRDSAGSSSQTRQSQHEQPTSSSAASTRQQPKRQQQQQQQQQHTTSQQSPLHQSQPLHHQSQQPSSSSLPSIYQQQHVPFLNSPSTAMPLQPNPAGSSRSTMPGIGGHPTPTGISTESIPPRQPPTVHSNYSPPNLNPGTQPSPQPPPGSATTSSIRTGSILNPISNPSAPPGYQALPFPPNRSMLPGPPPPTLPSAPERDDDASTAEAATVVARARSTSSRLSPEPALTLLPEDQRAIGHGARRPFQRRRRSRACDACRMRKTKCDTPDAGPCASCTAASLVCKFSEGGDEKRRIGPARQIRALESQIEVLKQELAKERQLVSSLRGGIDPARPQLGPTPMWPQSDSRDQYAAGFGPSGSTPMRPELQYPPQGGNMMGFQQPMVPLQMQLSNTGGPEGFVGMSGISTEDRNTLQPGMQGLAMTRPKRYSTDSDSDLTIDHQQAGPSARRGRPEDSSNWGGQYYGPTSAPTFANGYEQFAEHLGFSPSVNPAFNPDLPGVFNSPIGRLAHEHPPLLSDNTTNLSTSSGAMIGGGGDLRRLLPPREIADKLKEAFRSTIQQYTPMFYWPIFESTWVKTFSEPIYESDKDKIRENLCVVLLVMAVGAQVCTEEDQIQTTGAYYSPIFQGCFSGWKFFEVARKLHNLNSPVYTVADCAIFILMSLYLDGASLPSPTWMMVGMAGRVCEDLGLHKQPHDKFMSAIDIECRNRLFWTAFLLDQKIALSLGRIGILRPAMIEISEPGFYDSQGTGCEEDPTQPRRFPTGDAKAMSFFRGNIGICSYVPTVVAFRPFGNDYDADMEGVLSHDDRLRVAWERFPPQYCLLNPSGGPLDVSVLRALAIPQHIRLSVFRYFSDFSKPYNEGFRNWCLANSAIIASFTADLLRRSALKPDFDRQFAIRTNDMVHVHVFRSATILLLCYSIKARNAANGHPPITSFQDVDYNHLTICIRALRSAANRHPAAKRYYGLFEGFAALLQFNLESASSRNSPTSGQGDMAFSAESGEGSPGDYGPFSAGGGGSYSAIGNTGMMEGGQSASGSGGLDISQVVNVPNVGGPGAIDWNAMRNLMEADTQFGTLMTGANSAEQQQSMLGPPPSSGMGTTTGMVGGMMGTTTPGLNVNAPEQGLPGPHGVGRPTPPELMGEGSMDTNSGLQTGWDVM